MSKAKMKIGLVSMPQSLTVYPSIGLTQISTILKEKFAEKIQVEVMYPCLDFVSYVGLNNYNQLQANGLNQWIFSELAFPDAEDNIKKMKDYFFASGKTLRKSKTFDLALEKRKNIINFLDEVIDEYKLIEYDIVGFTSFVSQNFASFALARRIKEKNPSCIISMGGPNCDYPMGKTIVDEMDIIDYVFSGPGIISFPAFVDCVLNDDSVGIHNINGVFSKKNKVKEQGTNIEKSTEDEYLVNPRGDYHDVNMCIELDYDGFLTKFDEFKRKTGFEQEPILLFETSRGCWKRDALACSFCGLNDPSECFFSMKSDFAIKYMQRIIDKYSDRCTLFDGVDNILDKRYVKEVIPYLNVPKGVILAYQTSAAISKEEMTTCMENGVVFLQPGIESLNTEQLRLMKKGITAFTNILFLKHSIELGIYPTWNYLLGAPGECESKHFTNVVKQIPLLKHLPPPASLGAISFVRYSPYFDNPEFYGLKLRPDEGFFNLYPFEEEIVNKLAFAFVDTNRSADYIRMAEHYAPEINMGIIEWISAFRISSDFPKLYFKNDNTIFDSRYDIDNPKGYTLNDLEKDMLMHLERPLTIEQIEAKLPNTSKEDVRKSFNSLNAKKLLFNDEDRYLSLVCSNCAWEKKYFDRLTSKIALSTSQNF